MALNIDLETNEMPRHIIDFDTNLLFGFTLNNWTLHGKFGWWVVNYSVNIETIVPKTNFVELVSTSLINYADATYNQTPK